MAVPLALAAPSLVKGGLGLAQGLIGTLSKRQRRPRMGVPYSVQSATQIAQQQAQGVRPGSEQAVENLKQSTSDVVEGAQRIGGSATDVMGALSSAKAGERKGLRDEAVLNAQYGNQSYNRLINQLGRQGSYEQRAFEFNKAQPYYEQERARAGLLGSSIQNVTGAAEDAGTLDIINRPDKYKKIIAMLGGG